MFPAKAPTGSKIPNRLRAGISLLGDLDVAPVSITSSTVALTRQTHSGRLVVLNLAAGIAVTLPAATGSGDRFTIVVGTTFTGAATIKVVGNDIMVGNAWLGQNGADTVVQFVTAADSDTIDLLGTGNSTGGIAGQIVELYDMAADTWLVRLMGDAAGTEATPFSATVS